MLTVAANRPDTVVLQLKWKHQFQFAGFYAAIEQGYYQEAGLEVVIEEGQLTSNFIEEVISGRADYGIETPELLIAHNNEVPVVALAAIFQHSPEIILSTTDNGIRSPYDLVGKRLALSKYGIASTQALFRHWNISLDSIDIMNTGNFRDSLISGVVAAVDDYIIDGPYELEKEGKTPVVFRPIDYGIDFYGDVLFTSKDEIRKNPKRVQAFREASIQGWIYAMNNKAELIDLILTKYAPTLSKEALIVESMAMEELLVPKFIRPGQMNRERWRHIAETYISLGLLPSDYSLDGFLWDDYIDSSRKKTLQLLRISVFVIAVTIVILLLFITFNYRLRKSVDQRTLELRQANVELQEEVNERKKLMTSLTTSNSRIKSINEELKKSKVRAEESDRLKTAFLSNMSHEIRTPMMGIVGFVDLLKLNDLTDSERQKYLNIIDANSNQLLNIISDIIDISKMEAGQVHIVKSDVDLVEFFKTLNEVFQLKLKESHKDSVVELKYQIKTDSLQPLILNTDSTRLRQIFSNLIENAIKFTEKGVVEYGFESGSGDTGMWHFYVSDTGAGIENTKQCKVFDRFYKEGVPGNTNQSGTGLGLYIVKSLVQLLGGEITLESEPGVGTIFRFTHPK
jgi:signal transduction histidine kinase